LTKFIFVVKKLSYVYSWARKEMKIFGVWFLVWEREFSILHNVQTGSGAHPAYYAVGTGGEVDHSPPSAAEVKNGGAVPSLSHKSLWCGVS
jgi:hypothetical protein